MDFQPVAIEHKALFDEILPWEGSRSSSLSFGNVFLWDLYCQRNITRLGDRLLVEFLCRKAPFFAYPVGRGELFPAIECLHSRAQEAERPFLLQGITAEQKAALDAAFPGRFIFTPARDDYDYIYSVEALASLSGKKLHGKRNHCNKFEATYDWKYSPLVPALFPDCLFLLDGWEAEKSGDPEEYAAIRRVLEHWDELGMEGGILYADGRPAAFSIAEQITADTADVHFEKALEGIPGAYPMVARELARQLRAAHPEIMYLNREEDMGLPNLRKAKEEWYPAYLLEKYTAQWRDDA